MRPYLTWKFTFHRRVYKPRFLRLSLTFSQLRLIAGLDSRLPFTVEDANRLETESDSPEVQYKRVLLDTRLNNRVVELRVGITPRTLRSTI